MVTTGSHRQNPYIIGRPITEPELFFGREDLFEFIDENLRQKTKVILLHGQRRIGKSSVLNQIPNFIKQDDFSFVPFDLQDKSQLPISGLLHSLATKIIDYLELSTHDETLPSVTELEKDKNIFFRSFLPKIYEALNGKNLVLLMDEFDILNNDDANSDSNSEGQPFYRYLKTLLQEEEKLFVIPVVGRELDTMPKLLDIFKGAPKAKIGRLDESSAQQLITKPAEGKLQYEKDAIQAILELSAGHPYFTQIICFAIFGRAREQDQWHITRSDVDEIIVDKAIEIAEAGLVWFRQGLPIPERVVFSAVAELQKPEALGAESAVKQALPLLAEYRVVETEPLRRAQKRLVEWDYLQEIESSRLSNFKIFTYKVTIELVHRWLLKKYSLRDVIFQLETIDPEANRIYNEATEIYQQGNFATAVNLYEQVLKLNQNHFSAVKKLVEGYVNLKEFIKAIEYCERAYKFAPETYKEKLVEVRVEYSKHLVQQKQFTSALYQVNNALALEPKSILAKQQQERVENEINKAFRSPYIAGKAVAPDQFVGRESELSIVRDQILNSSTCLFCGNRGIGKTSFLKYIADPENWQAMRELNHNDKYLFVYLDCESIQNFTTSNFWKNVFNQTQELLNKLQVKYQALSAQTQSAHSNLEIIDLLQSEIDRLLNEAEIEQAHVKQVLRVIKRQSRFLVLLVDNYNVVIQAKDDGSEAEILNFLRGFSHLVDHYADQCLSVIMTSSQPLTELASETMNNYLLYPSQILKPFKDTEVSTLWNHMHEDFRQSDEWRQTVQKMTGGYPALLQWACFLLYNIGRDKQTVDIEQFKRNIEGSAEHIFRDIWQSLNDTQRMLLRLIALYYVEGEIGNKRYDLSGIENCFKEQKGELNTIEARGIIISTFKQDNRGEKKAYSFAASAMQEWVIKRILDSDKSEVDERERVFLGMNKGQANQIRNAIKWMKENADSVMPIAGGIQRLVTLLG